MASYGRKMLQASLRKVNDGVKPLPFFPNAKTLCQKPPSAKVKGHDKVKEWLTSFCEKPDERESLGEKVPPEKEPLNEQEPQGEELPEEQEPLEDQESQDKELPEEQEPLEDQEPQEKRLEEQKPLEEKESQDEEPLEEQEPPEDEEGSV